MTAIVADTHTIIWYLKDADRLSEPAAIALENALQEGDPIYIAAISLIEIIYLVEKNRIPPEAFDELTKQLANTDSPFNVVPLDLAIAQTLRQIPREIVPEMPDRIIAATAQHLNLPLVTRDLSIQALTTVQTIW
jgi:PIN domain nuclease of toxin-antitoxin system